MRLRFFIAAVGFAGSIASAQPPAGFESYLGSLGLDDLSLEYRVQLVLEQGASSFDDAELDAIIKDVVARVQRFSGGSEHWIDLANALVNQLDSSDSLDIQLPLRRAELATLSAETEKLLIGLSDMPPATLRRSLVRLSDMFDELIDAFQSRARALDARRDSRADRDGSLEDALDSARANRMDAAYRAMWSSLYAAILMVEFEQDERTATVYATKAIKWAEWVIRGGPSDEGISREIIDAAPLAVEQVAWAVVAAGYAESIRRPHVGVGSAWLELIQISESLNSRVSAQLPRYRVGAYTIAVRWRDAARVMNNALDAADVEDHRIVSLARRILVSSANSDKGAQSAADRDAAAEIGLTALLSVGATRDVVELTRSLQWGVDEVGFVASCVGAMKLYDDARTLHGKQTHGATGSIYQMRSKDASVYELYRSSAAQFQRALAAEDANEFIRSHPVVHFYWGISLAALVHSVEDPEESAITDAVDQLLTAADLFTDPRSRADALYIATSLAELSVDTQRADRIQQRFLDVEPSSARAAAMMLDSSVAQTVDDAAKIAILLSVSPESSGYDSARRRAADLLYRQIASAQGATRSDAAMAYVSVALDLFDQDESKFSSGSKDLWDVVVGRGLRISRSLLQVGASEVERAQSVLSRAIVVMDTRPGSAEHEAESAFLAAWIVLVSGQYEAALAAFDTLVRSSPTYIPATQRLLFTHTSSAWYSIEDIYSPDSPSHVQVAQRALLVSDRLLKESNELSETERLPVHLVAGSVCFVLSRENTRDDYRLRAVEHFEAIKQQQPLSKPAERMLAILNIELQRYRAALQSYRLLLGGEQQGTDSWFEYKLGQLLALSHTDERQAQAVLEQLTILYPELGPEPYRSRIRSIAESISGAGGNS